MTTLLARRIAAGPVAMSAQRKAALEAAWCEPLLVRRWQRVALRMSPACCEKVAAALPTAAAGLAPIRYLSLEQATEGWALDTRGLVVSEGPFQGKGYDRAGVRCPAAPAVERQPISSVTTAVVRSLAI